MVPLAGAQVHPLPVELVAVGIHDSVPIRFLEFLGSSSQMTRDVFRLPWRISWIVDCRFTSPRTSYFLDCNIQVVISGEMVSVYKSLYKSDCTDYIVLPGTESLSFLVPV